MVLAADARLTGRGGLGDPDPQQAMLWYTLHPAEWGKGSATEAARALVDFGFRRLGQHRIWADCNPANAASCRVLDKLGLRREGHLIENAWINDAWADPLLEAVLAGEWAGP